MRPETDTTSWDSAWPAFLDLLDEDPRAAFCEFYEYFVATLGKGQLRPMSFLHFDERADAIHDIVIHCCKNDFRVLRSYTDVGKPFSCWLRRVALHRLRDILRSRQRNPLTASVNSAPETNTGSADSEASVDVRRAIALTLDLVGDMDRESKLMLLASAEGRTPREIVRLLGWPGDQNKRVSERVRYLRSVLKAQLSRSGIDLVELIGGRRRRASHVAWRHA